MLLYSCSKGTKEKFQCVCRHATAERRFIMAIKFCTKCGKKFESVGREVICPSCKAAAQEEAKKAAVLKAKRASWTGESVPVRISGRASTVIRRYGAEKSLPFAAALDALLQASDYFKSTGGKWEEVEPYRSHRRDKHATENTTETAEKQDTASKQDKPQAASKAAKTSKTVKTAGKKEGKKA